MANNQVVPRRLTRGRVCSEVFNAGPPNIYDPYRGLAPRQFVAIANERELPHATKMPRSSSISSVSMSS